MCLADLYPELVHLLSVHLRADLPVQFPLHRADRSIAIGKLPFVAVVDLRARRCRRPTASNPYSLPNQPDPVSLYHKGKAITSIVLK